MGSASAYHLAKAGLRILGIDRFRPPHQHGSSHGLSRIIREAYFEHPSYVPLVQRAYQLWADLERSAGRQLLLSTGGLMIGPAEGALVGGARRSAQQHQLRHELLTASQIRERFPAFQPEPHMVGALEPRAGILFPELAVKTHLELAVRHGAVLHLDEQATVWHTKGKLVELRTDKASYEADWLVLSAGPWLTSLIKDLRLPLAVERQVLLWFEPKAHPEWFSPACLPVFIFQYAEGRFFYGFPDLGDGIKLALHHQGTTADPEAPRREPTAAEIDAVRQLLHQFIPCADGALKSSATCLYTNAPDEHFVLGPHPEHPRVIIVSPCSGHGFKFSPVVGEITADLILGRNTALETRLFNPGRFMPG